MTHFYAVDPSGVTRLVKRFFAVDPGGVSRMIKRGFVIDSGGAARLFFVGGVSFTITAGVSSSGTNTGYSNGLGTGGGVYGSISQPPSGSLPSGRLIGAVYDSSSFGAQFTVSNITFGDPGQSSLVLVILNGHTFSGAGATSYGFSGGIAHWSWGAGNNYGLVNGNTYSGLVASSGAW